MELRNGTFDVEKIARHEKRLTEKEITDVLCMYPNLQGSS